MKLFRRIIVIASSWPRPLLNNRIRRFLGDCGFDKGEYNAALLLYSRAVRIDDSIRQERLGTLYEMIGEEDQMAYHLMTAARFGNRDALEYFATYFIGKAPEKVAELVRELVQAGDVSAESLLISSLEAMDRYDDELIGLLLKGAEQGDALAQFDLGCCYLEGKGVSQDYARAYLWTLLAAMQGHPTAQNNIGYMYETGICVERNREKAASWFLSAASNGSVLGRENTLEYLSAICSEQKNSCHPM